MNKKNSKLLATIRARSFKKSLYKSTDIEDMSLESLKLKKQLLPNKIFAFGVGRHAYNPYIYFLFEGYRITLLKLKYYLSLNSEIERDETEKYLHQLPLKADITRQIDDLFYLRGDKARHVRPRIRRELLSKIEESEKEISRLIVLAKKRHRHLEKLLLPIKSQVERDIITVTIGVSGLLDPLNRAQTKCRDFSWDIDQAWQHLTPIHKKHELDAALAPTSLLFANEILELNFADVGRSSWEDVHISVSRQFRSQISSKEKITTTELIPVSEYIEPKVDLNDVILPEGTKTDILALCQHFNLSGKKQKKNALKFLFSGPPGTGKTFTAEAIAGTLGKRLLKVSFSQISSEATPKIVSYFVARAKASNSVLLFDECESMISYNPFIGLSDGWVKTLFEACEGVIIFTTNYRVPKGFDRRMTYVVDFKNPTAKLRERLLINEFKSLKEEGHIAKVPSKELASALAQEFNFPGGYYQSTLKLALAKSQESQKSGNKNAKKLELTQEAIESAFTTVQERFGKDKNDSVREPKISLESIKLETKVKDQVDRFVSYARKLKTENQSPLLPQGASALFSGPPGTGKTITAEAIAKELGLNFRRVSPSTFMSPWFGETESNVRNIFREAEKENYLLFIDEAEGMLGDRQGDISAIRHTIINEFLQQIESFKGVLIIATNFQGMMDVAFGRRFLFHMPFSIPSYETRVALWKGWQEELKLDNDVLTAIAQTFALSGGEIRNVAIKAGVNGLRRLEEMSQLCENVVRERTGVVKRPMGIRGNT